VHSDQPHELAGEPVQEVPLEDLINRIEQQANAESVTTDTGLRYVDFAVGEGASPQPTDTVEVHYRGTLVDGTEFDSSYARGRPATFRLNQVISGWIEGVGSMKTGGKRTLIIPPELGYGDSSAPPTIPPGATLVFEVELLAIK
jgi:FKBP-type peptidyl-prolyl cis-trans isomerase